MNFTLYIERWLKTPVKKSDEALAERSKETPQEVGVCPLLVNLFLHYCTDEWLRIKYLDFTFERCADDCVGHCRTEAKARGLKKELEQRLKTCELELHPKKTKIFTAQRRVETMPMRRMLGYHVC